MSILSIVRMMSTFISILYKYCDIFTMVRNVRDVIDRFELTSLCGHLSASLYAMKWGTWCMIVLAYLSAVSVVEVYFEASLASDLSIPYTHARHDLHARSKST